VSVAQGKKSSQSKVFTRCLLAVRVLPLERFHLPDDSRRQWRGVAERRLSALEHLAGRANPDGTFTREDRDYSPNAEKLQERFARRSLYRRTNELRDLGLLSWTRRNRQLKRTYRILMENFYWNADEIAAFYVRSEVPNSNPEVPPETFLRCHLSHSADLSNSGLNSNNKR
jgi:hypothetical protein